MLSLRRKADVRTLLHRGRRAYGSWTTLYARLRSPEELSTPLPRLAVSTTGKFPNAVQRNRARRLLRETGRLLLSGLQQPWDILLIARPAILTTTFPDRSQTIRSLLRQAGLPASSACRAGMSAAGGGRMPAALCREETALR